MTSFQEAEANAPFPLRDFRVSPERRADAKRARITVVLISLGLFFLSLLPWVFFGGGQTRLSLGYAALILSALSLLLLLRIALISRKADRFVAADGSMLRIAQEGIIVAGDTFIPWPAVSGVWALDSAPGLRARAARSVTGAPGRVMLRAGTNTANMTIGIADVSRLEDPAQRAHRFRKLSSGLTRGRIEIPFGSQFVTEQLHEAIGVFRRVLPPEIPARLADGALDYSAAWAGTADDAQTIREREASRP